MKLEIDHTRPVPLQAQVEDLLRELIQISEYKKNDFIPKDVELASD